MDKIGIKIRKQEYLALYEYLWKKAEVLIKAENAGLYSKVHDFLLFDLCQRIGSHAHYGTWSKRTNTKIYDLKLSRGECGLLMEELLELSYTMNPDLYRFVCKLYVLNEGHLIIKNYNENKKFEHLAQA